MSQSRCHSQSLTGPPTSIPWHGYEESRRLQWLCMPWQEPSEVLWVLQLHYPGTVMKHQADCNGFTCLGRSQAKSEQIVPPSLQHPDGPFNSSTGRTVMEVVGSLLAYSGVGKRGVDIQSRIMYPLSPSKNPFRGFCRSLSKASNREDSR